MSLNAKDILKDFNQIKHDFWLDIVKKAIDENNPDILYLAISNMDQVDYTYLLQLSNDETITGLLIQMSDSKYHTT